MPRRLPFAVTLACLALAGSAAGIRAQEPPPLVTEDVRYASDDVTLAALYLRPDGDARVPAAVIVQGSGNSGRNNVWSRWVAETVARAGYGVLLTDKRGVGASEGDWRTVGFETRAGDALAGLRYLASRDDVRPDAVGLVGLSQGGWVVPLAAVRSDSVAFVVNVSGATVSFAEQSFHEMANTARQEGLPDHQVQEVLELNRRAGRYAFTGDWEPYGRALEAALEGPWGPLARGFPQTPDAPRWPFIRSVLDFDPMPYWILVEQPVLVLYGEEDESDNVPVAESVRRLEHAFGAVGKENARIVVIPDAGHGFLDMSHRDPARHGLMPAFTESVTTWLEELDRE